MLIQTSSFKSLFHFYIVEKYKNNNLKEIEEKFQEFISIRIYLLLKKKSIHMFKTNYFYLFITS
jgi:hypothetical protein